MNFPVVSLMNGPVADAVSKTLFHSLWEGALIAAALAVATRLLRPSSAAVRYGLACAAMLAMVVGFAVTLAWFWPHSMPGLPNPPGVRVPPPARFIWTDAKSSGAPRELNWFVVAWLVGAGVFSLRSLVAWVAAMRLKRAGACAAAEVWQAKLVELAGRIRVSQAVLLIESCLTDVPVVIGFLRPAILVPAALFTGFPPEQLELLLLHELAHIRRHDYLVNLLQSLVEDVLFYHPAVWWVSSVIRAERENCCDDIVVAETRNAHGFAAALAALEQNRWAEHEAVLAANGGHLMKRVRRLLEGRDRPRLAAAPVFFAGLLPAVLVIAVSASQAAMQAQSVAQPLFPPPAAPKPPVLMAQGRPNPAPSVNDPIVVGLKTYKSHNKTFYFYPNQVAQKDESADQRRLRQELETPYKKWLNQEVIYIISQQEREAFSNLQTDEEREKFIEQFWLRRDPTPGTPENEYREETYRRIAYANESFGVPNVTPGWQTDRGMIYIKYGPPDEKETHASGGTYTRTPEEGGGTTATFPFERWRYRYIEGMGKDVNIEFVDTKMNGEYRMTTDPSKKDALLYVPGTTTDRFRRDDGTRLPATNSVAKPVVAPEDAIEDIVFHGNQRVPQDLLRAVIKTRTGDKFDKEAVNRDLVALWDTKRFTDIKVTYDRGKTGWILNFTVAEVPAAPAK